MRLTRKEKNNYYMSCEIDVLDGIPNLKEHANKLGQLEDLMEKYDIKTLSQVESSFIGFVTDYTEEGRNHIGQLLKLENELGIDLITLFKALKNGIYEKSKNGKAFFTEYYELSIGYQWYSNEYEAVQNDYTIREGYEFGLLSSGELLRLKDYGKTWALTKEELL